MHAIKLWDMHYGWTLTFNIILQIGQIMRIIIATITMNIAVMATIIMLWIGIFDIAAVIMLWLGVFVMAVIVILWTASAFIIFSIVFAAIIVTLGAFLWGLLFDYLALGLCHRTILHHYSTAISRHLSFIVQRNVQILDLVWLNLQNCANHWLYWWRYQQLNCSLDIQLDILYALLDLGLDITIPQTNRLMLCSNSYTPNANSSFIIIEGSSYHFLNLRFGDISLCLCYTMSVYTTWSFLKITRNTRLPQVGPWWWWQIVLINASLNDELSSQFASRTYVYFINRLFLYCHGVHCTGSHTSYTLFDARLDMNIEIEVGELSPGRIFKPS